MKKEEYIEKYGEEAYKKMQQQRRDRYVSHREEEIAKAMEWSANNPENVIANNREKNRKGGKHYEHTQDYHSKGIPHQRHLIRIRHAHRYQSYKKIIAPESQLHHQWVPETANYRGVALVEKDQHMHGFIDVIQILEGEITLFTEAEIRRAE